MNSQSEPRTDGGCCRSRYDKYTSVKESRVPKSSDQFTQAYAELIERVNDLNLVCVGSLSCPVEGLLQVLTEQLLQKADEIAKEFNRATKAALNAEQRCWPVPALSLCFRQGECPMTSC